MFKVPISEFKDIDWHNQNPHSQYVEPFTYNLLYILEKLTDKNSWSQHWKANPDLPHNEEALADFVMEMSPAQLLRFFAPLVLLPNSISK